MKRILISFLISSFITGGCIERKKSEEAVLVKRVIDGDTIELADKRIVRYIGIDTPEIRKKIEGKWIYNPQPYALEAKEFNRSLVENKQVRLEFDIVKKDRYDRLLAYVHLRPSEADDGKGFGGLSAEAKGKSTLAKADVYEGERFINLEMLKEGYAMLYTLPPNVCYVEKFIEAQKQARQQKKGFWGDLEEKVISYREAKDFIGRFKVVEGKVKNVYSSKKILILNFSKTYKNSFKVVIFKNNFPAFLKKGLFSLEDYYRNKKVRIFGLIKEYKGSPEIIVYDPSQIEIIP